MNKLWSEVIDKLHSLRELDRQREIFGAATHQYQLLPCVGTEEVTNVEESLNIELPIELKEFYCQLGNGVVGPHYGLLPIDQIISYRADEPYRDIEELRVLAAVDDDAERLAYYQQAAPGQDYFEVDHSHLTGLLSIIPEGCGHFTCLITNGVNIGKVVSVAAYGHINETNKSLIECYDEWIDTEIARFAGIELLMRSDMNLIELMNTGHKHYGCFNTEGYMISIANVEKPVSIFGQNRQSGCWTDQRPWYENVLIEWRKQNL